MTGAGMDKCGRNSIPVEESAVRVDRLISLSVMQVTCQDCSLSELCLPRGLKHSELEQLERIVRHSRPIHPGDHLFDVGDPMQSLYAIRSGSIKAYVLTSQGEEEILGFYLPGELLGFDGFQTGYHSCAAVAQETTSVCKVPFSALENLCQTLPGLHHELYRVIGREISKEQAMLLSLRRKNARERVASFLLNLSERLEARGLAADEFHLSMSRQDIANYLGLTEETVCRLFSRFCKDGFLDVHRRFCRIRDMQRLRALLGEDEAGTPMIHSG